MPPPLERGGRCPPLPSCNPHPWGGGGMWGGGGPCRFPAVALSSQARGMAPVPLQGGGVCLAAPFVAPSILRPHPRWSPRQGLHGARPLRARSCGSSHTLLPLPPHPAALTSGGGGRFSLPPYPLSPSGGRRCWGGVGRPFRLPSVARTSQACRRHNTTTGRGTWLLRGGGGFPLGLPALLHGIGPALQDHQPLLPPRR